jgi:hypothetical protein
MTGGKALEKLAFGFPGVPAGRGASGSAAAAQLSAVSPEAVGQIRSSDAE